MARKIVDGKAVVSAKELEASGLSLRDFLNKEQGLTRKLRKVQNSVNVVFATLALRMIRRLLHAKALNQRLRLQPPNRRPARKACWISTVRAIRLRGFGMHAQHLAIHLPLTC